MKLSRSEMNLDFLTSVMPSVRFELFQSSDSRHFINCFVAYFSDGESCATYWKTINNEIAVDFQASLTDEFASWNIYLALITPVALDKHLKYRIENDRFALRKIVLSGQSFKSEASDAVVNALEDAILGRDLMRSTRGPDADSSENEGESLIRKYLSTVPSLPLDGRERSTQTRRQRITELLEQLQSNS